MSTYGGVVTTSGRNMIATLIAGQTIKFTKVVFGAGKISDDTSIIDITDLIDTKWQGAMTEPVSKDGVTTMTLECRNDLNGGLLAGFQINEIGLYASDDNGVSEVLFYYASLGDSPQPMNPFVDNRVDIKRFPISMTIGNDVPVDLAFESDAFVTTTNVREIVDDTLDNKYPGGVVPLALGGTGCTSLESFLAIVQNPVVSEYTTQEEKTALAELLFPGDSETNTATRQAIIAYNGTQTLAYNGWDLNICIHLSGVTLGNSGLKSFGTIDIDFIPGLSVTGRIKNGSKYKPINGCVNSSTKTLYVYYEPEVENITGADVMLVIRASEKITGEGDSGGNEV